MSRAYHEDKTHGTSVFPLQVYSHHDKDGFYFVSQHWHEELEWVYAEYGILNLTIHGKSLVLSPGEFFSSIPENCMKLNPQANLCTMPLYSILVF